MYPVVAIVMHSDVSFCLGLHLLIVPRIKLRRAKVTIMIGIRSAVEVEAPPLAHHKYSHRIALIELCGCSMSEHGGTSSSRKQYQAEGGRDTLAVTMPHDHHDALAERTV